MIEWFGLKHDKEKAYVVCLGFFDGVHIGHRELITEALRVKRETGARVCVHTYAVPPVTVIFPNRPYKELTPLAEKIDLLLSSGADCVAVSPFDGRMMRMTGADFLDEVLLKEARVTHIVTGFNHRFGFRADTGPDELKTLCLARGIGLTVVPPVCTLDGENVSSTNIKQALAEGKTALAARMLGREPDENMLARFTYTGHTK